MKVTWTHLVLVVILAVLLVGCGAVKAPTTVSLGGEKGVHVFPAAAPTPAPARTATDSGLNMEAAASTLTDRLIIRNGNITIIVKNVTDTVGLVTDITNAAGGYVLKTDSRYQGEYLHATMTIKVPAESFDDIIAKLRKLAVKVDAESTSSQDVTEEYVDLEARLKVYEATEQQLLTFLQKTQNVDESLKVYRELNNVRSQIESVKGRMNYLKKSAAMSTITVQIRPEEKEKPIVEEDGWNPLRAVRDALRWLVSALQVLFYALVFLVFGLLPVLIIVAIPLLLLRALWRRWRRP